MSFEPRFYPFKVQRMWKNSQLLPENLGYCDGSHSLGVAIPKWTTTTGREEKRWTERINCSLHVACKLSHGQHDSNSKDHCPTKVSQAFSKAEESVSQLQSSSHIASEVCSKNQSAPGWRTGNGCSHTAGHTSPTPPCSKSQSQQRWFVVQTCRMEMPERAKHNGRQVAPHSKIWLWIAPEYEILCTLKSRIRADQTRDGRGGEPDPQVFKEAGLQQGAVLYHQRSAVQ